MALIDDVKTAYRAVARTELNDTVAAAVVAAINAGTTTLDAYIAGLVEQNKTTTSAGVAIAAFVTGVTPTSAKLDDLKKAADAQVASYTKLGVANPALGAFEAFGKGFAEDASTGFATKYGALSTTDFINAVYNQVFGTAPSAGAMANLQSQIDSFTKLYSAPGTGIANPALSAKGAVLGQIIGYAFVDPAFTSKATIDDSVATFLTAAAKGSTAGYGVALPGFTAPGQTFVLTNNPDAFQGTANQDNFVASEATLSSADVLDGAGGIDTLLYASSGAAAVNEAGFTAKNIEIFQLTSDAVGGTVFDMTGASGVTTVTNSNSSTTLQLTGVSSIVDVNVQKVSGGDTFVTFTDAALAGTADAVKLTLNGNANNSGAAASTVWIGDNTNINKGVETLNVVSTGAASKLVDLESNAKTINVSGDANLTINGTLEGATLIDASTFKGALNVKADSGALAVVVKGGDGNDTANFSNGFGAGDSFDGGAGTDTLGLTNALATGAAGGTTANVEQLNITDAGAGTLDSSKFAGVTRITYDAGLGAATAVSKAADNLTVEVDVQGAAQNLTITHATDTATNAITIDLDDIQTGDAIGTVKAADAETVNLIVDWDATTALPNTGTLAVGALDFGDATKIVVTGDAKTTVAGFVAPATPTVTNFDASGHSNGLILTGLGGVLAAAGSTVALGAGDDQLTNGTGVGADSVTLGAGKDTVSYTALNQSSGAKVDTIQDFKQGEDIIDVSADLGGKGGITASNLFVGNFANFGSAQGAITAGGGAQAVFQQDTNTLWVDVNDDGALNANDLQIILKGVTTLTAADLGFVPGNNITLTAPAAAVNNVTKVNSTDFTTKGDDTINSTVANLAGSAVDGLAGTDTLAISDGQAGPTVVLGGAFANIEKVTLSAATWIDVSGIGNSSTGFRDQQVTGSTGADRITITTKQGADAGDGDDRVTFSGTATAAATVLKGGVGTDALELLDGADISAVTAANFSGFEILRLNDNDGGGATYTMSLAQHNAFLANQNPTATTDTVNIVGSGTLTGRGIVEAYNLDAGVDDFTIGVAAQSVNAGAGNDTIRGSGALTGTINGGADTDSFVAEADVNLTAATLTSVERLFTQAGADIVMKGSGFAFNDVTGDAGVNIITLSSDAANSTQFTFGAVTGIETIDATAADLDDDVNATFASATTVNLGANAELFAGGSTAAVTVTAGGANGNADRDIQTGGGADVVTLTGDDGFDINLGAGNDTLNAATFLDAGKADVFNGGADTDIFNSSFKFTGNELNGGVLTNFETINLTNNTGIVLTIDDNIVAAGQSATFNLGTGATFTGTGETDGKVNVVLSGGTNTVTFTAANLSDSYTAAAGNDTFTLNANNTVANLANVDTINAFQIGGDDAINVTNASAGKGTYTVTIGAGTTLASFVGDVNTALQAQVGYNAAALQYDAIVVNVSGGALAGQYFIQDSTAAAGIDATALVVKLVGAGVVDANDFI